MEQSFKSKSNEQVETKISNIQNLAGNIWIGFPRRKKSEVNLNPL
jgi:hypothetical protein